MTGRGPLGKTDCLADGLWFIHGEMPEHAFEMLSSSRVCV